MAVGGGWFHGCYGVREDLREGLSVVCELGEFLLLCKGILMQPLQLHYVDMGLDTTLGGLGPQTLAHGHRNNGHERRKAKDEFQCSIVHGLFPDV